jgi:predicted lipid-binding transport protein (Tim44 family)
MGASSGFPLDLVLFGMIAAFLVLRLRSILGRRTGFERTTRANPSPQGPTAAQGPVIEGRAEPPAPAPSRPIPDPASDVGQSLARMRTIDPTFDVARFLEGAEKAFRLIVAAFASGDRTALRSLLSDDTYRAFAQAIEAREAAGQTQISELRRIEDVTIEAAELRGSVADVTVRFVSDQVSLTRDKDNHIITGTDAVTEIIDLWTFERDLSTRDPTWRLIGARST